MDFLISLLRWGIGGIFLILSAIIMTCNFISVIRTHIFKDYVAPAPYFGGIFGIVALAIIPVKIAWYFMLLPLVVDYGTLPLLVVTTIDYTVQKWRKKDAAPSKSFADLLQDKVTSRTHYKSNEAARIIRDFVDANSSTDPYEWDDFETATHLNLEADLALNLCWRFANRFPARHNREYCAPEAFPYFIKIADLLESGQLHRFANADDIQAIKNGNMSEALKRLIFTGKPL